MRKTVIIILAATFTAVAMAGNNVQVYKFGFAGAAGPVEIELDSETMGFGLDELQPGDVRTTVTAEGTVVTITRNDETLTLGVNGEDFEIPAHPPGLHRQHPPVSGHHAMVMHGSYEGLTVISHDPLDETRQMAIRDAFAAAGVTEEVRFVAPGHGPLPGGVFIEKQIEEDGSGERTVTRHVVTQ